MSMFRCLRDNRLILSAVEKSKKEAIPIQADIQAAQRKRVVVAATPNMHAAFPSERVLCGASTVTSHRPL